MVRAPDDGRDVAGVLGKIPGVTDVAEPRTMHGTLTYVIDCDQDVRAAVGRALVGAGLDLLRLDSVHSELEQTFLRLVGEGGHASN